MEGTAVTTSERVSVTVELVVDDEPIKGFVGDGQGPARPFLGWLELATALEAARTAPHTRDR